MRMRSDPWGITWIRTVNDVSFLTLTRRRRRKKKQTWSLTGTLSLDVCTGFRTFTLTAGEVPSLGWDPCITLWWPLTSSSRFTELLPVQSSAQEAVTFLSTSANFSALLSLFREEGVFTLDQSWNLCWADAFEIFLLPRWKTSTWFDAARPLNTTFTLSKHSCCKLSKVTDGLKIISKREEEECLIEDFSHVAGRTFC